MPFGRKGTDLSRYVPLALFVLRVVVGLLFLEHGTQKILGFPHGGPAMPSLATQAGVQGLIELIGGALILVGLFTRPVAFILCGDMAVAYWTVHAPKSFYPMLNGGDAAILFCFAFLFLVASGPGPMSVDGTVRRVR